MQSFDLVVKPSYVKARKIQIWFPVGCALFLFLLVVGRGEGAFVPAWPWGVIAAMILATGLAFLLMGRDAAHPFADRMEVSEVGLTLTFPKIKPLVIRWNDPHLRVAFVDYRNREWVRTHPDVAYWNVAIRLGIFGFRLSPIPGEALDAALTAAEAQGCRVRPSNWREAPPGTRTLTGRR